MIPKMVCIKLIHSSIVIITLTIVHDIKLILTLKILLIWLIIIVVIIFYETIEFLKLKIL